MPVVLGLAEMQQGALLQDFVKEEDCGPSGRVPPVCVESAAGSANQHPPSRGLKERAAESIIVTTAGARLGEAARMAPL